MTRFWLSPTQAAELVVLALKGVEPGVILIPKMPALSIGKLAEYAIGVDEKNMKWERIPLRPGEKIHEELLTIEETDYAAESKDFFFLRPTTSTSLKAEIKPLPYSSDVAPELARDELAVLLNE